MERKVVMWGGCFFFFLYLSMSCWALTLTMGGQGPTRQAAINNGLRAAIEEGLGSYVESKTKIAEGKLDYDRIISASSGYIRNYNVIAEGKDPIENVYKVKLHVDLNSYKLKNLAKEFRKDPRFQKAFQKATFDQRRVVILYSKRTSQSLPYRSMAVKEIVDQVGDKLSNYGFRVFLPEQIKRIKTRATELSLDEETAIQIARQEDGDAVVLTDVAAGKRRTSDGYWIINTTLGLKAFDVTTGELFASVTKRDKTISRGGSYGIEEGAARAVEKAGNRATNELVAKIVKRFSTNREKFVVFIFRDIPEVNQDRLYSLFQSLRWKFRVARQHGTYMEVEVFSEADPTSANLRFKRAMRNAKLGLSQVEMKGTRIIYSGQ